MEKSINDIKQLTCTCKKCDTKITMAIGSVVLSCPVCNERFVDFGSAGMLFTKISECIKDHQAQPFVVGFVCDDA